MLARYAVVGRDCSESLAVGTTAFDRFDVLQLEFRVTPITLLR
jgi:hypothetical protein